MDARFLITDIVRAIINQEVFKTSSGNIIRDFITPPDFYSLIQEIIDFKSINTALDCYTKSPVSKFDLLNELKNEFGFEYEAKDGINIINASGAKLNYYSTNYSANRIGYTAKYSSLDGIFNEIKQILIPEKNYDF